MKPLTSSHHTHAGKLEISFEHFNSNWIAKRVRAINSVTLELEPGELGLLIPFEPSQGMKSRYEQGFIHVFSQALPDRFSEVLESNEINDFAWIRIQRLPQVDLASVHRLIQEETKGQSVSFAIKVPEKLSDHIVLDFFTAFSGPHEFESVVFQSLWKIFATLQWAEMPKTWIEKSLKKSFVQEHEAPVKRALYFTELNLFSTIGIGRMAAVCGVSVATLFRAFQKETGQSPHQFIMGRRFEESRNLLEKSARKIDEIARAVGYRNPNSFTEAFHELFGQSPTAFRRQMLSKSITSPPLTAETNPMQFLSE